MRTMGLKSVRSNNFGKQEPKKLGNVLVIACAILSLCILSLVKAHYFTAPYAKSNVDLKLEVPRTEDHSVDVEEPSIPVVPAEVEEEEVITTNPICYESSERSDTCEARRDVRVQGSSRTIFVSPATTQEEWKIKPYARKNNAAPLAYTKEWSLKPFPAGGDGREQIPQCTKNYTAPAVLFSIGGFTGNVFHDFTDVLIPLFITARRFKGEVHLLVSDTKPWWLNKYGLVLSQLSKYEFIETERSGNGDGDGEEDDNHNSIHCFPKIIAGKGLPTIRAQVPQGAGRRRDEASAPHDVRVQGAAEERVQAGEGEGDEGRQRAAVGGGAEASAAADHREEDLEGVRERAGDGGDGGQPGVRRAGRGGGGGHGRGEVREAGELGGRAGGGARGGADEHGVPAGRGGGGAGDPAGGAGVHREGQLRGAGGGDGGEVHGVRGRGGGEHADGGVREGRPGHQGPRLGAPAGVGRAEGGVPRQAEREAASWQAQGYAAGSDRASAKGFIMISYFLFLISSLNMCN
ncbi:uncharacterized protein M6B38_225035 [Iris pallida]|uniref:Uncharacterized protein n=1 Tax=Iris pallida TaxID=29817 RepID=A0AAX6DUM8_IRIPA|nr:uncharacterized protein M6B38_225035 [Iris pallida]